VVPVRAEAERVSDEATERPTASCMRRARKNSGASKHRSTSFALGREGSSPRIRIATSFLGGRALDESPSLSGANGWAPAFFALALLCAVFVLLP
jgi:hypothetical protein